MKQRHVKFLSLFFLAFFYTASGLSHKKPVLNIYSWAGYLPEIVLKQFTEETGIQINHSTYESNEAMYVKLKYMPQNRYDLVIPSSYTVHRMIQENMLQPLDRKVLSHFRHLDPQFLNQVYDPHNQYSIPFLFSVTGIVVNSKRNTIVSWKDFWNTQWKNQLLILDDLREVFAIALLSLGFSPNTRVSEEIKKAYVKLQALSSNIRIFNSESLISLYADEDLKIGMGWSGDIYHANQLNEKVHFICPKEGFLLNVDSFVIPANAKNSHLAHQFINFLLRPEIAAQITLSTGYATANKNAKLHLPEKMVLNPMIYPDTETLKRSIVLTSLGNKNQEYEKYWNLLKA